MSGLCEQNEVESGTQTYLENAVSREPDPNSETLTVADRSVLLGRRGVRQARSPPQRRPALERRPPGVPVPRPGRARPVQLRLRRWSLRQGASAGSQLTCVSESYLTSGRPETTLKKRSL